MLKRQNNLMAAFSMASMTDVIFLLLIFFMVTSTFVFPTGLEVNLPQGSEQSALKPVTRVYIDANDSIYASTADERPQPMTLEALPVFLRMAHEQDSTGFVALYADESVKYGRIVEVLSVGADHDLKMVLATRPVSSAPNADATASDDAQAEATPVVETMEMESVTETETAVTTSR